MLQDTVRYVVVNILGTLELLQNVAVQLRPPQLTLTDRNLNGQVCIVTGGNAGIGRETSQALVARGAHVILACRNTQRAAEAAQALKAVPRLHGCESHPVEVAQLDLASLASVKAFAADFNSRGLPLDILVCNAGIMAPPKRLESKDGLEQQFQVNYLGHWLLTRQLLAGQQKLRSSCDSNDSSNGSRQQEGQKQHLETEQVQHAQRAQRAQHDGTRVLLLTSMTHKAGRIQFGDLAAKKSYTGFRRYADSKLAELLAVRSFSQHMDRAAETAGVRDTIVAVHPGLIQTDLARQWVHNEYAIRPLRGLIDAMFRRAFLPPAYAMEPILHAITAPVDAVHGKYIVRRRAVKPDRAALDDATARRLWNVSCDLTGMPQQE